MKINNIEFEVQSEGYSENNLMLVFPHTEFTHFFSTVEIDKPLNIEGYEDYVDVDKVTINPKDTFILEVALDRNDEQALSILTNKDFVSVTQAKEMRSAMEKVSTYIPDDEADKDTWLFPVWSGNSIAYAVGDRVQYEDVLYKCIQAHTSQSDWTPDTAVSLWVRTNDPKEEYPKWIQPTGSEDAYNKGDKVTYEGKHYVSTIDSNVWSPKDYPQGWEEVEQ